MITVLPLNVHSGQRRAITSQAPRPGGYDAIIEHDLTYDYDGSFRRRPGHDPPAA